MLQKGPKVTLFPILTSSETKDLDPEHLKTEKRPNTKPLPILSCLQLLASTKAKSSVEV